MRGSIALALLAPVLFALVAGCTTCPTGPPVSARGIAATDDSAGTLGYELTIHVTDGPGGAPLPGAGVVVYYSRVGAQEWNGPRVEVRPDLVIVDPAGSSNTVEAKTALRMMTNEGGFVRARVPGQRIVGVVAAMDGFTEEWIPALAAGETAQAGSLTLPLYRSRVVLDVDSVWGPGSASPGAVTQSNYGWDALVVPFGASEDADRGYAARVIELEITVNWTNGATAAGDLGIGVGPPEEDPRHFSNEGNNVATGAQSEHVVILADILAQTDILGAPRIMAGAATNSAFVAPFGLPYTMHVEALFDAARAALADCSNGGGQSRDTPGLGLAAVAAVVALAALLATRRGRG